jgi:hypothetical protein
MGSATLNGVIISAGGLPCEGRFQYGKTPALGTDTPWIGGALGDGDTFSQLITGLAGNTIYYFRAQARNSLGTSSGSILNFITAKGATAEASVEILSPTDITEYSATLNGMVLNSEDDAGSVRFQYGLTTAYGMMTAWQHGFATGNTFNADIRGLSPSSAYHCRAEFGGSPSIFSKDLSFSTLAEIGGITLVDEEILRLLEV